MIELELPWPAKEVWPNYRQSHHWSSFTKARKAQREYAHWWTLKHLTDGQKDHLPDRIQIHVEFYPPDRRNRDDDGCIGAFKSARDGIADALAVDDKRFKPVYWFMEPEKPGKIVVKIG